MNKKTNEKLIIDDKNAELVASKLADFFCTLFKNHPELLNTYKNKNIKAVALKEGFSGEFPSNKATT